MPDIPLSFEWAEPMVSPSVIPGVAGCVLEAGQFVYCDPVTEMYHGWQHGGPAPMPHGIAVTAAQIGEVVQIMAQGVFDGIYVVAPSDNASLFTIEAAPTVLPGLPKAAPGSICEQCFDAPALVLCPAPWGGDMGMCLVCAMFPGEEA